jgi:hypothetical protein
MLNQEENKVSMTIMMITMKNLRVASKLKKTDLKMFSMYQPLRLKKKRGRKPRKMKASKGNTKTEQYDGKTDDETQVDQPRNPKKRTRLDPEITESTKPKTSNSTAKKLDQKIRIDCQFYISFLVFFYSLRFFLIF